MPFTLPEINQETTVSNSEHNFVESGLCLSGVMPSVHSLGVRAVEPVPATPFHATISIDPNQKKEVESRLRAGFKSPILYSCRTGKERHSTLLLKRKALTGYSRVAGNHQLFLSIFLKRNGMKRQRHKRANRCSSWKWYLSIEQC